MSVQILTQLNLIVYFLACLAGFFAFLKKDSGLRKLSTRLLEASVAMHAAFIAAFIAQQMEFSISSRVSMASLWLLVTAVICLVAEKVYRLQYTTFFFLALPLSLKVLQMGQNTPWLGKNEAQSGHLLMNVHSVCSVFALAFLTTSFVAAVLFLILEFHLKRKKIGFITHRFASLNSLDEIGFSSTLWGFLFLTLSIVTGALAGRADGHVVATLGSREWLIFFAWLVYVLYFQVRVLMGQLSHRLAVMAVFSYLVQLGALFLVIGIHRF